MRSLAFAAILLVASAGAALAQPSDKSQQPPPTPEPPRVFTAAGYSQPDITPGYCKNLDAQRTACTIPAMTAGSYYVEAVGASTATAAGAGQQLTIAAGDQACTSRRLSSAKDPWPIGVQRSLKAGCVFTVVTDSPVNILAVYVDDKATKDPKGPVLAVRRVAWAGVLNAVPLQLKQ